MMAMSYFKKTTALFLSLIIVIGLCGCSYNPGANKIISMDTENEPKNIDPQLASSQSELTIARNTMTGLFRINDKGNAEKSLCEEYKVSSDGLTYEFKIKDAKWSNGDDITADDFVFGITRALSPETKSPYANTLFFIKNAEQFNNNESSEDELGVKLIDKKTFGIILNKEVNDIEYRLADIPSMPCNRNFFNKCKGKYGLSKKDMLYFGPFYVSNWTDKNIKMSRNAEYIGEKAKPATLTMTFNETANKKIDAIKKNVIDIAIIESEKETDAKKAGLTTHSVQNTVWAIIINPNTKITENPLTVSAMSKSINRHMVEDALPSGYSMFSGLIAPELSLCGNKYSHYINEYSQSSLQAKEAKEEYMQAIKETGSSLNGSTLLYVNSSQAGNMAIKIAASWQSNLDAYINTEGVTFAEMKNRIKSGNYTVALYPIGYGISDAETAIQEFKSNNKNNIFGIKNENFDSIMENAQSESDANKKAELLHNAENCLIESNYIYPVYISPMVIATTPKLSGYIFDLYKGNFDFSNAVK